MVKKIETAAAPAPQLESATPHDPGDTRYAMIAEAAYHRAAKRGFAPDREIDDWLEAEKEIAHLLLSTAA